MNLFDLLGPSVNTPSEGLWAQVQAEDRTPQGLPTQTSTQPETTEGHQ